MSQLESSVSPKVQQDEGLLPSLAVLKQSLSRQGLLIKVRADGAWSLLFHSQHMQWRFCFTTPWHYDGLPQIKSSFINNVLRAKINIFSINFASQIFIIITQNCRLISNLMMIPSTVLQLYKRQSGYVVCGKRSVNLNW